jgi:hypothetical protein
MVEQAVIVKFEYNATGMGALTELQDRLSAAFESAGDGEYDGNDLALDLSEVSLYFYGSNAEAVFEVAKKVLESAECVHNAVATLRYGPPEDGVPQRIVRLSRRVG